MICGDTGKWPSFSRSSLDDVSIIVEASVDTLWSAGFFSSRSAILERI